MGACVSRPSACVRKPHTPRSDDAGGRSGGGARRRRARRGGGKGRRKAPSRTASMETIQEAEVPGPAPGADAAGDNRTYSNPAFQGGWLGRDGTGQDDEQAARFGFAAGF
jgi:hypothetical protein